MIEFKIFWIVILIVFTHTILEHLFNWWFRDWSDDELFIIPVFIYIVKIVITVTILRELLWNI